MAAVDDRPFPPGTYDVVVVGSGPGGLQTSYSLARLGIEHAVLSADDEPGGMFQRWPIFQRLITWTKPDAPVARDTREYEWYDHNSLVADEPELRATVPRFMDRTYDLPSREEMLAGLQAFAGTAGISVRHRCTWESTRREDDAIVLVTSDGEYRCRATVFAIGVTEPWVPELRGIELASHYVDTRAAHEYENRDVVVIGKRNSGFEVSQALLPWARSLTLVSPRPVETRALALSALRVRYLHPYDEHARGGPGTHVLDAAIDRIERHAGRLRVVADGTTADRRFELEADDVIAATGFGTPLLDLPGIGLATVADGRIPALTPFWESVSVPGVFFAGNATQGARGLGKRGLGASSSAVNGFRYNARVLARHLAERLGTPRKRVALRADQVVPLLLRELATAPELWVQKGYLARVVALDGPADEGVVPVSHFLDADGPDAVAAAIEVDAEGTVYPILYVRRSGEVEEHAFDPHPLRQYASGDYEQAVAGAIAG